MMQSKLVVAGAPSGALAALAFVAEPAQERVFDQLSEGTAWRFPLHDLGARVPQKKIAAFGGR